ncbi:hypothetical protein RRF57_010734 [Xylaria bambusicola]|uniref:Uncharacterized protein n=1 Tax=Xylaria bambusicola TaxID=326684 RepID=A0AAN7USW1_9PEZI
MLPAWLASNLLAQHADEILVDPITRVSAEHIEILKFQGPTARSQKVIYLSVVVQKKRLSLGDFLACEVVDFKLEL